MKFAPFVIGPAGSGKSTFCRTMLEHCNMVRRNGFVVNLDPAAESFDYPVAVDIRDLIQLDECMEDEELHLGPNGGLVYCMEYLLQNLDWLQEQLEEYNDDDFIIFDCPGQIELYSHIPVMRQLVDALQQWNFRVCSVHILDSQFMTDSTKFISGVLVALSAMISLETPHINVLSKCDLLTAESKKSLDSFLDPNLSELLTDDLNRVTSKKFLKLNKSLLSLIDDYSLVAFCALDITDEESIGHVLLQIDTAIQYGEDLDPRQPQEMEEETESADSGMGMDS